MKDAVGDASTATKAFVKNAKIAINLMWAYSNVENKFPSLSSYMFIII